MSDIIKNIKEGIKYTYKGMVIMAIKERGDTIMLTCFRPPKGTKKVFINKRHLSSNHFKEVKDGY